MSGYIYIITNRKNGALYTGITADVPSRMTQHREKKGSKFAAKYDITRLVYMEEHADIRDAIAREKAVKKWRRAWKIELIESVNPDWRDLFHDLNGSPLGGRRELGPRFRGDDESNGGRDTAMTVRTGVYPGTFDPVTLGHMDIIRRGATLVDRLVIGVTTNPSKSPMFSLAERMAMVEREVAGIDGVHVVSFDSLLMDFAEREGAAMIVRGLRAVADFEYEYQMAGMNQQLNNRIETVFLMADVALQPIASRLVKEIALYGGEIGKFVPPTVRDEVAARVAKLGRKGS